MGIFDFFKSKKSNGHDSKNVEKRISIPTITPEKELFEYYDEVYSSMIKDIVGLTKNEANEILKIIKKCDGGFLNMSGYYSIVWNSFFKEKIWQWREYEEWYNLFNKLGRYPSRFPIKSHFLPATIEESLNTLTVSELKSMCKDNHIILPAKSKKKDFVDLLKVVPGIDETPIVIEKVRNVSSKFEYELYSLFMRTISFRAKGLYDIKRAEKVGINKFKIMYVFEDDKEFVELALKKNPNALHPVFPSDMSMKRCVTDF